ncbi:MAG: 6-bladed beta-propeller [Balneolales bacterium]|nr:6-bladed beta-propeller [Balneolales bacterium]
MNITKHLSFLLISLFIVIGCASDQSEYHSLDVPEINLEPVFVIQDSDDLMLGGISDVQIMNDGTIVVLDQRSKKLHLFDENGEFIRTGLNEGQGPGEIQFPSFQLSKTQDNKLMLFDFSQRRYSIFEVDAAQISPITDVTTTIFPNRYHLMDNGEIVVFRTSNFQVEDGVDHIMLLNSSGEVADSSMFDFSKSEFLVIQQNGNAMMSISTTHHPKNLVAFEGNKIIHAHSGTLGFTIYDINTKEVLSQVALNRPEIVYAQDERRKFIDDLVGRSGLEGVSTSQLMSQFPEFRNKVDGILYDPAGYVWLRSVEEEDAYWLIFSENGDLLAKHNGESVTRVIDGQVFSSTTDEDGAPILRVYQYSI